MEYIVYTLKIVLYFIFVFIMYNMSKSEDKNRKRRIKITSIIFLCICTAIYAILCGKYPYVSDRLNYAFRFRSDFYADFVKSESLGLYLLEYFLHLFTYEPIVLFMASAIIYLAFTLIAYNEVEDVAPLAILLLGITDYMSFGYYMIKQAMATAFVACAYAYLTRGKKVKAMLFLIIGVLFHEATLIVIPILIMLKLIKNNFFKKLIYILTISICLLWGTINGPLISLVIKFVPSLESQIYYYLDSSGSMIETGTLLTWAKGFPFYFIFLYGLYKKKELKEKIKYYDEYMFITFLICATKLTSVYMYWMFRFGISFYFPSFVFASLILKNLSSSKDKYFFRIVLVLSALLLTVRLWCQYYFLYGGI